ncbi:hypothetical protein EXIGLDRAFT_734543 [Exidia glandulosa HHB12029]|uniref:F-box domain-containing protein n=1 Tax=Exidia glandulosa HHB12029 TaxID=1314781 RepID=A0A165PND7_EXIGL|nr:hypothetical protein EXIGLDRAFT_734543 [Exidia glandulosa HHB12029]
MSFFAFLRHKRKQSRQRPGPLRDVSNTPRQSSVLSIAEKVPPEVLVQIFDYLTFVDSWEEYRVSAGSTLYDLCLVCQSWSPAATTLLYRDIVIASRRACELLDQTLARNTELCKLVATVNFLPRPWPRPSRRLHEHEEDDWRFLLHDARYDGNRGLPDDRPSSTACLSILRRCRNLGGLAVKSFDNHPKFARFVTFQSLRSTIPHDVHLKSLSLTGDSSQIHLDALLQFLSSVSCSALEAFELHRYSLAGSVADWPLAVPPMRHLTLACGALAVRPSTSAYISFLRLFQDTVTTLALDNIDLSAFPDLDAALSGFTALQHARITVPNSEPTWLFQHPVDLSYLSTLTSLELGLNVFTGRSNVCITQFPPKLKRLELASHLRHPDTPFHVGMLLNRWLREHMRVRAPGLESLDVRICSRRVWDDVARWKIALFCLAQTCTNVNLRFTPTLWIAVEQPALDKAL